MPEPSAKLIEFLGLDINQEAQGKSGSPEIASSASIEMLDYDPTISTLLASQTLNSIFNICYQELLDICVLFSTDNYYHFLDKSRDKTSSNSHTQDSTQALYRYVQLSVHHLCHLNAISLQSGSTHESRSGSPVLNTNIQHITGHDVILSFRNMVTSFEEALLRLSDSYSGHIVRLTRSIDDSAEGIQILSNFILERLDSVSSSIDTFFIRFLLLTSMERRSDMEKLVIDLLIATYDLLPINATHVMSDPNMFGQLLSITSSIVQLQQLIYLQRSIILAFSSTKTPKGRIESTLHQFFRSIDSNFVSLDLLIAVTVRIGLTVIFSVVKCYDHLGALLKCPLKLIQSHSTRRPSNNDSKSVHSSPSHQSIEGNKTTNDSISSSNDSGYEYFYEFTRQEAIQILTSQPPGRFLVRPHETNPNQLFLSFRNQPSSQNNSNSNASNESEGSSESSQDIRHAIIRVDVTAGTSTDQSSSKQTYRCGKIGPYDTLNELLQAVDKFIGSGLIFRPFTHEELPEELGETISSTGNTDMSSDHCGYPLVTAHSLALKDPNYDFWLLTNRKIRANKETASNYHSSVDVSSAILSKHHRGSSYYEYVYNAVSMDQSNRQSNQLLGIEYDDMLEYENIKAFPIKDASFSYGITTQMRSEIVHEVLFLLSVKALQKQLGILSLQAIEPLFHPSNQSTSESNAASSLPAMTRRKSEHLRRSNLILRLAERICGSCRDNAAAPFAPICLSKLSTKLESFESLRQSIPPTIRSGKYTAASNQANDALCELLQTIIETFVSSLSLFVMKHDQNIHSKLLPTSTHLLTSTTNGLIGLSTSTASVSYQSDSSRANPILNIPDVLQSSNAMAEYVVVQLFRHLSAKTVKIPAVLGAGGFFSPNIAANSNLSSTSHQFASLTGSNAMLALTSELPMSPTNSEMKANNINPNLPTNYEYMIEGLEPVDVVTWLIGDGKYCLKLGLKYGIFDRFLNSTGQLSSSSSNLVGMNSPSTPMTLSNSMPQLSSLETTANDSGTSPGVDLSKKPSLHGDASNAMESSSKKKKLPSTPSELTVLAKYLLTWLVQQRVLVNAVKPQDSSFTTASNYFKYRDLWEVKLAIDSNALPSSSSSAKSKLGRQYYSQIQSHSQATVGIESGLSQDIASSGGRRPGILSTILMQELLPPSCIPSIHYDDDFLMLTRLWDALKGDWYLVHSISVSHPSIVGYVSDRLRADANVSSSAANTVNEYQQSLSKHLYRNAMLARMCLPYRYIASLQVDVFGLKEVRGRTDHFSFVHSSATNIEVYSTVRLMRQTFTSSTGMMSPPKISRASSASSTSSNPANPNVIANRLELVASQGIVTASKRVDSVKAAAMGSGSSSATEYSYRENLLLKFPLPEEGIPQSTAHSMPMYLSLTGSSDNSLFPLLVTSPQVLVLSVYEKTFFSEKKLGEVELSLADVNEDKPFRDWLPLSTDKAGTWLVHIQLQLKFDLMFVDNASKIVTSKAPDRKVASNANLDQIFLGGATDQPGFVRDTTVGEVVNVLNNTQSYASIDPDNAPTWLFGDKTRPAFASTTNKGIFTQAEDVS